MTTLATPYWRLLLIAVAASWPCSTKTVAAEPGQKLTAMTFNILTSTNDGENSWPKRREMVFEVIRQAAPDVLGLQEALRGQLDELATTFPEFAALGVGRQADGGGEYSALLYRRARFDVEASGTFWLSATPEVPGSTSWGNQLPRICCWARLFDRSSGNRLYVYNTHWDHQSQPARVGAGELIAKRVAERVGASDPVIVLGDFNVGAGNNARAPLVDTGMRDSFRDLHAKATEVGTFNAFDGRTNGKKIDAVLVSKHWQVVAATIDRSNRAGRYPSDHFPVTALLRVSD